jgi:hypothetical protein
VENKVHGSGEDQSCARAGYVAENSAILSRLARNLPKRE